MSLNSSRSSLANVTKELARQWQETKNHWDDSQAREFEKKYMEDLLSSVDNAMAVIDQLEKIATRIRRECE